MKGDKILKVYGNNTFMYEIDKGWVVPEIAPDPEYFPPYVPPSTNPDDLEFITNIQWVSGKLDYKEPATEDVIIASGRYTSRWVKVKPDSRYIISSKFTNAFVLQSKTEAGVISYITVPSSVTNANTPIQTKSDTAWVRFYFYVGYEVLHELSMQQFVVEEPEQIPPFDVTGVVSGYLDGNKEAVQKDPYAFNRTTTWFNVKPNTTYLTYFSQSNRFYLQFKGQETHWGTGSISYPITMNKAERSSANGRYFTTKENTIQARIWFAEDLFDGTLDVIKMYEQLPTTTV